MNQRTKNRLKEHSGENHNLQQTQPQGNNLPQTNQNTGTPTGLFTCTCGWKGWLDLA